MNPPNAILHELLNLAEIMLTNGAEVSRVEETLNRMGHAYGATQMNVFAITSSIVVTMVFEEGEEYTQTRRITTPVGTDFFKLEQANALSRRCCSSPLSLADLKYEINKISKISPAPYTIYLGSMLGAGGFSVFFGGTILDGAIAVIFAFLLCFLQRHLNSICSNTLILQFFCSLLSAPAFV
ncbi:threonine/serine exporter family protein [Anaerobutyricum hallii]|nr:threonine/serine exporter family protein [Anaerobutyricum hallii]